MAAPNEQQATRRNVSKTKRPSNSRRLTWTNKFVSGQIGTDSVGRYAPAGLSAGTQLRPVKKHERPGDSRVGDQCDPDERESYGEERTSPIKRAELDCGGPGSFSVQGLAGEIHCQSSHS